MRFSAAFCAVMGVCLFAQCLHFCISNKQIHFFLFFVKFFVVLVISVFVVAHVTRFLFVVLSLLVFASIFCVRGHVSFANQSVDFAAKFFYKFAFLWLLGFN